MPSYSSLDLPSIYKTGRILVVGLGGGCDIITAYVLSQCLPTLSKNVAWANTKRAPSPGMAATSQSMIYRVTRRVPIVPGKNYYGTCGIDESVPVVDGVAPLVCVIPRKEKDSTSGKRPLVPEDVLKELGGQIAALGFDAVIGVDAGGDSLTGGIDHDGGPQHGHGPDDVPRSWVQRVAVDHGSVWYGVRWREYRRDHFAAHGGCE